MPTSVLTVAILQRRAHIFPYAQLGPSLGDKAQHLGRRHNGNEFNALLHLGGPTQAGPGGFQPRVQRIEVHSTWWRGDCVHGEVRIPKLLEAGQRGHSGTGQTAIAC